MYLPLSILIDFEIEEQVPFEAKPSLSVACEVCVCVCVRVCGMYRYVCVTCVCMWCVELLQYGKLAYCTQDVHNIILLYCNTDVIIIKPVTEIARICSASLKATRRLIALGFHTEKEVCQHSHSSDSVPVHTIHWQYIALCNIFIGGEKWKLSTKQIVRDLQPHHHNITSSPFSQLFVQAISNHFILVYTVTQVSLIW